MKKSPQFCSAWQCPTIYYTPHCPSIYFLNRIFRHFGSYCLDAVNNALLKMLYGPESSDFIHHFFEISSYKKIQGVRSEDLTG